MRRTYSIIRIKRSDFDNTPFLDISPTTIEDIEEMVEELRKRAELYPNTKWIDTEENKETLEFMRDDAEPGDIREVFPKIIVCTGYE